MGVTNEKILGPRRAVGSTTAIGKGGELNVQYGSSVRIHIVRDDGQPVILILRGELDVPTMGALEQALRTAMEEPVIGLIVDLTDCQFISAQGYGAIGRCSLRTPVEVRSRTDIATRVFAAFGFDGVTTVTTSVPALAECV
jgi:anti-anti-sigma factor